jgi:UDP-N-acetylglucosamine 1-carboxyvinyltransferase
LNALIALGADITTEHGYAVATAKDGLKGARIRLPFPSVGATETAVMAAVLAEGTTVLENAACEPEVVDLAGFLNRMGANVEGAGTPTVTVHGVNKLSGGTYTVMSDRIEAGTYMVAGAIAGGKVEVSGCASKHNQVLIDLLRQAGVEVTCKGKTVTVERKGPIRPIARVETEVYPGFPTDLQAQLMALLALADGTSVIQEHIFDNRFMHVSELCRMGADIRLEGNTATIRGVKSLSGVSVMASDLRASAALVLAGLAANGETEILRVYHIDRGYEAIEKRLSALGADVQRVSGKRETTQPFDEPLTVATS